MNRRAILIIEDSDEEREILCRYLEFVGGQVLEASDGNQGIRVAENQVVDLILLDISMPGMDGWQTIERLQQNPRTAMIPVVALTAHHLDWEQLESAGFCGYLEKPINPYRVVEEIERCIGRLDMPWTDLDSATPVRTAESTRPLAAPAAPDGRARRRRRSAVSS